jgi:hypothetical protein
MSALAIVLIVIGVVFLLFLIGGFLGARRRDVWQEGDRERHIAEADQALEQARAADRGWDRAVMEAAVRRALEAERPELRAERLDLVLVDDRPGVEEDRAHFMASGPEGHAHVVLARGDAGWAAELVE